MAGSWWHFKTPTWVTRLKGWLFGTTKVVTVPAEALGSTAKQVGKLLDSNQTVFSKVQNSNLNLRKAKVIKILNKLSLLTLNKTQKIATQPIDEATAIYFHELTKHQSEVDSELEKSLRELILKYVTSESRQVFEAAIILQFKSFETVKDKEDLIIKINQLKATDVAELLVQTARNLNSNMATKTDACNQIYLDIKNDKVIQGKVKKYRVSYLANYHKIKIESGESTDETINKILKGIEFPYGYDKVIGYFDFDKIEQDKIIGGFLQRVCADNGIKFTKDQDNEKLCLAIINKLNSSDISPSAKKKLEDMIDSQKMKMLVPLFRKQYLLLLFNKHKKLLGKSLAFYKKIDHRRGGKQLEEYLENDNELARLLSYAICYEREPNSLLTDLEKNEYLANFVGATMQFSKYLKDPTVKFNDFVELAYSSSFNPQKISDSEIDRFLYWYALPKDENRDENLKKIKQYILEMDMHNFIFPYGKNSPFNVRECALKNLFISIDASVEQVKDNIHIFRRWMKRRSGKKQYKGRREKISFDARQLSIFPYDLLNYETFGDVVWHKDLYRSKETIKCLAKAPSIFRNVPTISADETRAWEIDAVALMEVLEGVVNLTALNTNDEGDIVARRELIAILRKIGDGDTNALEFAFLENIIIHPLLYLMEKSAKITGLGSTQITSAEIKKLLKEDLPLVSNIMANAMELGVENRIHDLSSLSVETVFDQDLELESATSNQKSINVYANWKYVDRVFENRARLVQLKRIVVELEGERNKAEAKLEAKQKALLFVESQAVKETEKLLLNDRSFKSAFEDISRFSIYNTLNLSKIDMLKLTCEQLQKNSDSIVILKKELSQHKEGSDKHKKLSEKIINMENDKVALSKAKLILSPVLYAEDQVRKIEDEVAQMHYDFTDYINLYPFMHHYFEVEATGSSRAEIDEARRKSAKHRYNLDELLLGRVPKRRVASEDNSTIYKLERDFSSIDKLIKLHDAELEKQIKKIPTALHLKEKEEITYSKAKNIYQDMLERIDWSMGRKEVSQQRLIPKITASMVSLDDYHSRSHVTPKDALLKRMKQTRRVAVKQHDKLQYVRYKKFGKDKMNATYHKESEGEREERIKYCMDEIQKLLRKDISELNTTWGRAALFMHQSISSKHDFCKAYKEFAPTVYSLNKPKTVITSINNINALLACALEKAHEISDPGEAGYLDIASYQQKVSERYKNNEAVVEFIQEKLKENIAGIFSNINLNVGILNIKSLNKLKGHEHELIELMELLNKLSATGDLNLLQDIDLSKYQSVLPIALECVFPRDTPEAFQAHRLLTQTLENIIQIELADTNPLSPISFLKSPIVGAAGSLLTQQNVFQLQGKTLQNLKQLLKSLGEVSVKVDKEPVGITISSRDREKFKIDPEVHSRDIPEMATYAEKDKIVKDYKKLQESLKEYYKPIISESATQVITAATLDPQPSAEDDSWFASASHLWNQTKKMASTATSSTLGYASAAAEVTKYVAHRSVSIIEQSAHALYEGGVTGALGKVGLSWTGGVYLYSFHGIAEEFEEINKALNVKIPDNICSKIGTDKSLSERSYMHTVRALRALDIGVHHLVSHEVGSVFNIFKNEMTQSMLLNLKLGIDDAELSDDLDKSFIQVVQSNLIASIQNKSELSVMNLLDMDLANHQSELNYIVRGVFPIRNNFDYARLLAIKKLITFVKDMLQSSSVATLAEWIAPYISSIGKEAIVTKVLSKIQYLEEAIDSVLFEHECDYSDKESFERDQLSKILRADGIYISKPTMGPKRVTHPRVILRDKGREIFEVESVFDGYIKAQQELIQSNPSKALVIKYFNECSKNGTPNREMMKIYIQKNKKLIDDNPSLKSKIRCFMDNLTHMHMNYREDMESYLNHIESVAVKSLAKDINDMDFQQKLDSFQLPSREVLMRYLEENNFANMKKLKSDSACLQYFSHLADAEVRKVRFKFGRKPDKLFDKLLKRQDELLNKLLAGQITSKQYQEELAQGEFISGMAARKLFEMRSTPCKTKIQTYHAKLQLGKLFIDRDMIDFAIKNATCITDESYIVELHDMPKKDETVELLKKLDTFYPTQNKRDEPKHVEALRKIAKQYHDYRNPKASAALQCSSGLQ